MKEVDGVISTLAEVKHDTDISAGFDAGSNDGVIEKLSGDYLAAGKSEEQTSGFDGFDSKGVEPFVCLYSIVAFAHAFGKGGWVNDDDVEDIFVLSEVFQHIGRNALVIVALVEDSVVLGEGNCLGRNIHGYY